MYIFSSMNASIAYRLVDVAHSHFSQLMVNAFVFVCMVVSVSVSVYVGEGKYSNAKFRLWLSCFDFSVFFYEQINIAEKNIFFSIVFTNTYGRHGDGCILIWKFNALMFEV